MPVPPIYLDHGTSLEHGLHLAEADILPELELDQVLLTVDDLERAAVVELTNQR